MHLKRCEFTICLYREGYHVAEQLPPTLDLPAPPEKLRDLLDQARVDNPSQAYIVKVTSCHRQYLFDHLDGRHLDLIELNHLADRLAGLIGQWIPRQSSFRDAHRLPGAHATPITPEKQAGREYKLRFESAATITVRRCSSLITIGRKTA